MQEFTLYSANPSRGLVCQWLLAEMQLPHALIELDFDKEEQKSSEYLAINPMGKVPTLVHNLSSNKQTIVTETGAICMYLADLYPEKNMSIPVDSPLRGEYLRWCFYAPVSVEPAVVTTALGMTHTDYQPFADVQVIASTLQQALDGREYIVGDHFTAADIAIGSAIYWGLNLMPVLPKHPQLVEYWQRLEQRPAWQSVTNTKTS